MNETWKSIPDFEGYYEASNLGRIRSIDRTIIHPTKGIMKRKGLVLKPALNHKGYYMVVLCKNGINNTVILHRVIARTWLLNTHDDPQINHIDGNKTNNKIENLEWCNNSYNMNHALNMGLFKKRIHKSRKPVLLIKDNISISFNSGLAASMFIKTSTGAIGNVLNGTRKSIKGYMVEYL